jgi:hypothetical protein
MELAREEARRYLPNTVPMLAAIAFSPDSEAGLHTRQLCTKQIADIAGVIPQATPSTPLAMLDESIEDGRGGDA